MKYTVLGITVFTVAAVSGLAIESQAAPKKVSVPVIRGAKMLSIVEKGGVTGMAAPVPDCPPPPPDCDPVPPPPPPPPPPPEDCPPPPPPVDCPPLPTDTKPGYGFGTTGHYGPPGQGFVTTNSWRAHVANGLTLTPKYNAIPPRAFR